MTGCKHSIWKILSAAAAVGLILPRLALGDIGVCPPYSRTFGPDSTQAEIEAFLAEINVRPGGGTIVINTDTYTRFGGSVTGVVCIRATYRLTQWPDGPELVVETGGILTIRSAMGNVRTDAGGILFADSSVLFLDNAGAAYLQDVSLAGRPLFLGVGAVRNNGTLGMTRGKVFVPNLGGFPSLDNELGAYAFLDRVLIMGLRNSGTAVVTRSTLSPGYWLAEHGEQQPAIGNDGILDLAQSIVHGQYFAEDELRTTTACDGAAFADLGYNVIGPPGGCSITEPTSLEADPIFVPDYPEGGGEPFIGTEIGAGSPAIDIIPLDLCTDVDGLGRARTDGDADGVVACDAGALEYGHVGLQVDVRTTPYWKMVGVVDLSAENTLFVTAFSDASVDATTILFDSIDIEGFDARVRGPVYQDNNRDGLLDLAFWYRLDRDLDLDCGDYDQHFEALTADGQMVVGQLRFEATGCTQ